MAKQLAVKELDFQQLTDEHAKHSISSMREELAAGEEERERVASEGALSVEVRSDWYAPGDVADAFPSEYRILLSTGGPASRIVGELDERGQVINAKFEYQDWFKPWTVARLSDEDEATLLEYARQFWFGV